MEAIAFQLKMNILKRKPNLGIYSSIYNTQKKIFFGIEGSSSSFIFLYNIIKYNTGANGGVNPS